MKNTTALLQPEGTYHIYNRANGNELLFSSKENYRFFLQKFRYYISPYLTVYAYCLLPNHFHFLVKVNRLDDLIRNSNGVIKSTQTDLEISKFLSKQFSRLCSCYTQSYNNKNNRMGSLFMKTYRRILVTDNAYLRKLVHYIHFNPQEAKLSTHLKDWEFSSYADILTGDPFIANPNLVVDLFDDMRTFQQFHGDYS